MKFFIICKQTPDSASESDYGHAGVGPAGEYA